MHAGRRVVVVGGGVSGLATAAALRRRLGPGADLTVLEAATRLGGKVAVARVAGHDVDTGPDALMVVAPGVRELLGDLGIATALVAPAVQGAYVWSRGRLRPLPAGTFMGVPDRIGPVVRSRILSPLGLARAGLDLVLPVSRRPAGDTSVADLVRPRLGDEVSTRLVEPLLGGVYAGRASELSARSAAPEIDRLARSGRSLFLAVRRARRSARSRPQGPPLMSLRGGLTTLVDALAAAAAAQTHVGTAATSVRPVDDRWVVVTADGAERTADAVVLAVPAFGAAALLVQVAPSAAGALRGIPYADVATVVLAYPRGAVRRPLDGTGFLVPPADGRWIVGASWSSVKWPHLADDDHLLVRCMVGRHGDDRWTGLDDDDLVRQVHAELVEAMGIGATPVAHAVARWPRGMPQYLVGHQDRLDDVAAGLADLPGLHLTGAGYRGVGLAKCLADADRTAADVVAALASRAGTAS